MIDDDLFARARGSDIVQVAGVRLYRAGKRMRGPCPICGASERKRADGAFSANPITGWADCWACGWEGDVIALEQELRGGTPREAAERLVGPVPMADWRPPPRRERPPSPPAEGERDNGLVAMQTWFESVPAPGTLVEAYLRARRIASAVIDRALPQLRFHPAAYWGGPDRSPILLPAMVAPVRAQVGVANLLTGGVHLTYLAPDGSSKADRTPAKRMFGPQSRAGRPGGAWLIGPEGEGDLVAAEGIETALSAASLEAEPCRVVAALSLTRLQGGWLRNDDDLVNLSAPRADPERPAFVWRAKGRCPWPAVKVAVDRDMKPIRMRRVVGGVGPTSEVELDGDARARLCASLALQHWAAADRHPARSVLDPGAGLDFNDLVRLS